MNTELIFRRALPEEVSRIVEIIDQGRQAIALTGSDQWQDGYPNQEVISLDLERNYAYVLADNERVWAYGAVVFDGEPAYDQLRGEWLAQRAYVTLHRLAVAQECTHQGVGREFVKRVADLARDSGYGSFRVDTHQKNRTMIHLLEDSGFTFCGLCYYDSGERRAYEKLL